MASKNKTRGYRFEKAIADDLGTFRMGTMGGEDVFHPNFSIECKDFARFSGIKILEQAENNNSRQVTPIGVVHIRGTEYDSSVVLIRWKQFKDLIK